MPHKPPIPMYMGPVSTERGTFTPTGPLRIVGETGLSGLDGHRVRRWAKPKRKWRWPWESEPLIRGFRFIVGLHSNFLQRSFSIDDLRSAVQTIRLAQVQHAGSSFVEQKGLWTEAGVTKPENSVQVAIIHMPWETQETEADFETHMLELGDTLAVQFGQDYVHGEYQENGIVVGVVEFYR